MSLPSLSPIICLDACTELLLLNVDFHYLGTLKLIWITFYLKFYVKLIESPVHLVPHVYFMLAADIAEMLSTDLQKEGLRGRTLTLKLKTASFEVLESIPP